MMARSDSNLDVKAYATKNNIYLYELADGLGVSVSTLTVRLRKPLDPETKRSMMRMIDKLADKRK